jgi:hypothetical protein
MRRRQPQGDADDEGKHGGHREQQQVPPAPEDQPQLGAEKPKR